MESFDDIRKNLQRLGIARFYYDAARKMILRMFNSGVLPQKEPLLEYGKVGSKKNEDEFWTYSLFKQMLTDTRLIDAYLLGENIIPQWSRKTIKGKEYKAVKFYPASCTKTVTVFVDSDD